MTLAKALRVVAVLDVLGPSTERRAKALGGFLTTGLVSTCNRRVDALTYVFHRSYADESVKLTVPTEEIQIARVPPHRPDLQVAVLTALQSSADIDLYVFPSGPIGIELASGLAARASGSVLTGVLTADVTDKRPTCSRVMHSGHLVGQFALGPRPWCLVLDTSWYDTDVQSPRGYVANATARPAAEHADAPPPLCEIELLETPSVGDLKTARFLIVAGRGAGNHNGVERIAAAAARLGAAFGATRPVVMSAWASPDRLIGASGTRTAPAVCIVAGASGAPAFISGIERAGFIVAINSDHHSAIAREADVFVAGDAVTVVEMLARVISEARGK